VQTEIDAKKREIKHSVWSFWNQPEVFYA